LPRLWSLAGYTALSRVRALTPQKGRETRQAQWRFETDNRMTGHGGTTMKTRMVGVMQSSLAVSVDLSGGSEELVPRP
jgi:hypothetical protein